MFYSKQINMCKDVVLHTSLMPTAPMHVCDYWHNYCAIVRVQLVAKNRAGF